LLQRHTQGKGEVEITAHYTGILLLLNVLYIEKLESIVYKFTVPSKDEVKNIPILLINMCDTISS